ncbi:hypothetical protein FFK22_009295 [Mycobacterium sp. KBS0706]|uniref:hypothetical protein n=1 Tax=Mycobacterium sp. KBS0706 TaxID=2578109 RepID=UPI00110FD07F|nr:hypothetical protein [Mycobacterium sp. KBS0706]TSD88908.1 hypothetical protein FFK22_009295 [Mycobacterium sp. KBS0706]
MTDHSAATAQETTVTEATTATVPCLAHGGDRAFSRACRSCAAFALTCFPPHPLAKAAPATVEAAK